MNGFVQDRYWPAEGFGGNLRVEHHFDGRSLRCYAARPPNLDALFRETATRFAEREALVGDGRRISYAELERLVANAAGNLSERGIAAGERVALLLGNCCEFLIFVLACARLGAIAVPIGTRQRGPELEYLLNDSAAAALVFASELAPNVPPPGAVPALRRRIVVGLAVAEAEPVEALLTPAAMLRDPAIREDDTAIILYTSGTTGRPKGAMLTHLGIIHGIVNYGRCLGLGEADRALLAVPASHVTGLVAILLTTLAVGGSTIMMREFKARAFLDLAARERVTYTLAVPAIYILCLMEPEFGRFDLSAWRLGGFGGAPMPEATIRALAERLPGLALFNAYGATETTSPTTIMPPGLTSHHPESVGQVVPCGEVAVVDERGKAVPPGSLGEIRIRGPMVVPGYWNRPDATAASFTDGFWHSGDIGSIDAAGFVRIFDRVKDMINRGGYKIFSAEIENVLSHHPEVVECAVVGRPDPVLGERVQAFVLPRTAAARAEEICRFCAERVADYKVPEIIEFVAEPLPRNANGKVMKALLRERIAAALVRGREAS